MARTDYGAILSTVIKDTSDAVREVNGTSNLIAPNQWGTAIRTMHSDSDYENALEQMIEETATGDIASFSDGANNIPCPSVLCTINPVQDLHGQDYPYPSGGGKNKLPITFTGSTTVANVTVTAQSDGGIKFSGTKNGNGSVTLFSGATPLTQGGSYIFSWGSSVRAMQLLSFDANNVRTVLVNNGNTYSQNITIPSDSVTMEVRVVIDATDGTQYNTTVYPMIRLSTVSDPTYAPYSNICPITGHTELNLVHTGTNLWDEEWEVGGINGTTGQNDDNVTNRIRSKNYIPVPQAELYLCAESGSTYNIYEYDSNKSFLRVYGKNANTKLNITADASYIRFLKYSPNTTTYNHDISINYPSTDTSYHAYTGSTTTTDLGTTVYGGNIETVSGVLTIDRAYLDASLVSWQYFDGYVYTNVADSPTTKQEVICNIAKYSTSIVNSSTFWGGSATTSNKNLCIKTPDTTSLANWNTYLNNNTVQFVYPLATPTTIQLTPQEVTTLLGENSFYHDCNGQVAVTYRANGQLYVEQHS